MDPHQKIDWPGLESYLLGRYSGGAIHRAVSIKDLDTVRLLLVLAQDDTGLAFLRQGSTPSDLLTEKYLG